MSFSIKMRNIIFERHASWEKILHFSGQSFFFILFRKFFFKLKLKMNEFIVLEKLGEGSFGEVYRVRRIADGQEYALKKVDTRFLTIKQIENTLNEVRILASIDDPNIIAYKDAFYDENRECICLITELAEGGDLQSLIRRRAKFAMPFYEYQIWKIAYDILKGLKSLFKRKIIHRDIKSANIFLSNGTAKIGDLNVSKVTKTSYAYSQAGTPYYTSPEVWKEEPYSYKSDIWSVGCVLYEICMFRPPFLTSGSIRDLGAKILRGKYDPISNYYSFQLRNFIAQCLVVDAHERSGVEELLEQVYLYVSNPRYMMATRNQSTQLLDTIQIPYNMRLLNLILPAAKYDSQKSSREEMIPLKPRYLQKTEKKVQKDCIVKQTARRVCSEKVLESAKKQQRPSLKNIVSDKASEDRNDEQVSFARRLKKVMPEKNHRKPPLPKNSFSKNQKKPNQYPIKRKAVNNY